MSRVTNFFLSFMMVFLLKGESVSKTHLWLAGDSTMAFYANDRAPQAGWGMPFEGFFDSTVVVHNKAIGGRSTRTFISQGKWKLLIDSVSAGDYVFIQFGHNDEAKEEKYKDRYTPVPDYKINLERFVRETRAKNAVPILVTPVSRLKFDNTGMALETHHEYTSAMQEVAAAHQVKLIDLDSASRALYQQMGPDASKLLFLQLPPGEHPNYPDGIKDNTHFTIYGARCIAELVLKGIRENDLGLAEKIVKGTMKR